MLLFIVSFDFDNGSDMLANTPIMLNLGSITYLLYRKMFDTFSYFISSNLNRFTLPVFMFKDQHKASYSC